VTRKLVRTGFTLVMPRWGGWTSDLSVAAEVFGRYYPAQAQAMAGAAVLARAPVADAAIVPDLIGGLGGWLAQEYGQVIGGPASAPSSSGRLHRRNAAVVATNRSASSSHG
jgi:hypothetical protein